MDNEKFGKFIKELRIKNNMTQKDLAKKINITDKAISKWERGLSFPDISMIKILAKTFNLNVSEILNAEYGKKDNVNNVDIEKLVNERLHEIELNKEKKKINRNKIKKKIGIVSLIICILFTILQLGYLVILKRYDFEYTIDYFFYIVNFIVILSAALSTIFLFHFKKEKIERRKVISITCIAVLLNILNVILALNNTSNIQSIISFSNNLSNELVLKKDTETGKTTVYKNVKLYIFARPKETLGFEVKGDLKIQWLTDDICSVTYTDRDGNLREYVATYGFRTRTDYYNVNTTMYGDWQTMDSAGALTKLSSTEKGFVVTKNNKKEIFSNSDIRQFGTIALVLYKNEIPKYVVALNPNCELDEKTLIIKKDGTLTICEVSMKSTKKEELYCTTYKSDNLDNYSNIQVEANKYTIKNGYLYVSYDGKNIVDVPGNFSRVINSYNDYNYQIDTYKTVFFNSNDNENYLIYSDDMGKNWQTTYIDKNWGIQNIHFINKDIGFLLEFEDRAGGTAFGKLLKTTDGGKTWRTVSNGIGNVQEEEFKTSTQILFIDENVGFLTMPHTSGNYSKLYITKNSGSTFELLEIEQNNVYDYYNIPTYKNGILTLEIGQGNDGDYNGGDSKTYISTNKGSTWELQSNQ